VGRFLKQLERSGHMQTLGKLGRVLTPAGRDRMEELRIRVKLAAHEARLAAAASPRDIDELIDLLHVRRAVEVEAARLAATYASNKEIEDIVRASRVHVHCIECQGQERVDLSNNFHVIVSKVAHSRMISATTTMLLDPQNKPLAQLLDRISDDSDVILDAALEHEKIAVTLRMRNPDDCEKVMRDHIDKLINVVVKHRDDTKPRRRSAKEPRAFRA
jgi:GntR family transcriptional regulator, transcriptional repressor for pyruvate dehydrogenase complex